ncbi:hypothetical protein [Staphylococcus chromogenes]|uniref:hypothetical protein n=1 Tax=Staphylococcus chromogenes TaxID=46126 RepID=UPI000D1BF875|nr:hypothetical protein [Staphylococcus chromogenes]PTF96716.1 hypothetical protein BU658_09645 [Staphylococcus chromogenes]PTG65511.1 hypothetical protein BU674_04575 [Staphylococcus chromogenes]PTG78683.1 hypothetical protein BU667_08340 [Staphylococcus chromogenes]RIM24290.1 hypothetical protein BU655_10810 [Staphylococcus chromogenes]
MKKIINQVYVIETKDGDFYQEEVEVYGSTNAKNTLLKVTQNVKEAKRFAYFREANDIAYSYGFKVLALNTYLEDVN